MARFVTLDEAMQKKFGVGEPLILCGADGKVLGCFVPAASQQNPNQQPQLYDEETAPRMPDGSRAYTTTEVLLHLLSQPRRPQ